MVKMKKGFLKKTGCILISTSIILTGVTFFGSSVSEADLDGDIQNEELIENTQENSEIGSVVEGTTNSTTAEAEVTNGTGETTQGQQDAGTENPTETAAGTTAEATVENTGATAAASTGAEAGKTETTSGTEEPVTTEGTQTNGATVEESTTAETTETTASTEETTLKLATEEIENVQMQLFSAPMMLASSLASTNSTDSSDTEATYSGSTLVYVPSGASGDDHTFTVRSGTTSIAAGALSDSDVLYLVITDAASLTSISTDQGSWLDKNITIYCPNDEFSEDLAIVQFVNSINNSTGSVTLNFGESGGEDDTTNYTITYEIVLIDSDGDYVDTVEGGTETVEEGNVPNGTTMTSYTDDAGITYNRVTSKDPTLTAATASVTYTYTFQSSSVATKYNITIVYQLNNSSGTKVTDVTAETQTVVEGVTPTHSAPSSYDYNGTTYYLTTSPTFVAATADATYTYVYTAAAQGETVYTIQYQLQNTAGSVVATQAITTTTTPNSYTPLGTYTYGNVTYTLQSTTPAISGTTYTYTYKQATNGGGSSGGSSGGGGSSSCSSGSSSVGSSAASAKPVSDAAKSNFIYQIIEGAGQVVGQNAGTVRIVCNGPVEKLAYIMMDGNIIPRENYTIASGSTIMTLSKDYIANMALGDHAVQFQYTDGYAITGLRVVSGATKTTTTVTYKVSSDGTISAGHVKDDTPKTADGFDTRYLLCLAIFLLGAGAIMMSKEKRLEAILAGAYDEE